MDGAVRARRAAVTILHGFEEYHERFQAVTRRALRRFEQGDWDGVRRDTAERFRFHPRGLAQALEDLRHQLGAALDKELWSRVKELYTEAVLGRDDFELAQTFFNSLSRKLFPHVGLDPAIDFVPADFPLLYRGWEMASARTYAVHRASPGALRRILEDTGLHAPFHRLDAQCTAIAARLEPEIERLGGSIDAIDVLRPVFVRNKSAYVVGRLRRGRHLVPLLLPILYQDDGLQIDAVLTTENEASIVFSFARWYFHAEVDNPRAVVGFLSSILPRKRIAELYISLGYSKHGKTELYGDVMKHVSTAAERFHVAPGERGLVMAVFTMPSLRFVFKVIKDRFPASKRTSRREIREKYRHVLLHDRVGRLVDFQEFEDVAFPRHRFEPALLDELLEVAGETVQIEGDQVVIGHMYVGRRVTPLDLFVRERGEEAARAAVIDWGYALKDLAAAGIFAGDMLLKNFGVTRHGRVVFYDYDELRPLGECSFRPMPQPRDEIEELYDQPFFSVAEGDVFPEEMRSFLGLGGALRAAFESAHADLFGVDFWRAMQKAVGGGEMVDFFPYRREKLLAEESSASS
ncbi:MAG: bifunctional isocitrate dehydrogenase kinase/phosphatase [Acidobacteriota bacterium]